MTHRGMTFKSGRTFGGSQRYILKANLDGHGGPSGTRDMDGRKVSPYNY